MSYDQPDHLARAAHATRQIARAVDRRNREIALARAAGATWREIALATGITDHGIRKIVIRAYGTLDPDQLAERASTQLPSITVSDPDQE